MPTVLVTGATGLLGRQVARAFASDNVWTVRGTGFSRANGADVVKADLTVAAEVSRLLDEVEPQVIVHCAAQKYPDKVARDFEGARRLNVDATATLARLCAARSIVLIYISSDYVFSGAEGEAPYETDSPTGPTNEYGQLKLDGERVLLEEFGGVRDGYAVALRVPVLYGDAEVPEESSINSLMDVVWKAAKPDASTVKMDHWTIRKPTNTQDVARVCRDVAAKYLHPEESGLSRETLPRVLQFSATERFTKYEICKLFGEIMGLPTDRIVPNTEGNDPNSAVKRPYDCTLSTKALQTLDIEVSVTGFEGWWRWQVKAVRR